MQQKSTERYVNTHQRFYLRMKINNEKIKIIQLLKIMYPKLGELPKVNLIFYIRIQPHSKF